MHQLCGAPALRDELEEIGSHRVHATQGAKEKQRGWRRALPCPRAAPNEREDLSPRGPPEMSAERKVDVHDRVRTAHPPIDHRPWTEAIDDPGVFRRPSLQRVSHLVERCAPPAGKPLDLIDLVHGNVEVPPEGACEARLASASVADDRDASHHTIVTRKRERGPPTLPRAADLARTSASTAELLLFGALREHRVLGLLGDPELQHALRRNRDRLTCRRVPSHASLAVDDHELADARNGEAAAGFLVRECGEFV